MSIQKLKEKKIAAIRAALEECPESQFSEGLKTAFQTDGERYKTEITSTKSNETNCLEPIIFVREFIQPVKEKKDIDQVRSEPVQQTKTEDISRLLESLSIFTLSSSQIPTKQKSVVLQNLIKLTFPNLKEALKSIDFKQWSDDTAADLMKEIINTENMASANITQLIHAVYYPKVDELTSSAPRLLMNSILSIAKQEGKSVIDGLIVPLLFQSKLDRPQFEIITKTISESLNASQRLTLLKIILSDGELYFSSEENLMKSRKYLRPWNSSVFQILNAILTTQPLILLDKDGLFDLIQPIQTIVELAPKDKSSMQLILVLTSKYPQVLVEFDAIELIEKICQTSTMFLKRSVQGRISSIKKNLPLTKQ
ncbi:hypothetical protein BD770DRAFT_376609 [Pilaira anomala]|nr:hypothetical protein BD770DRAFT_376609 [Pilaira anomala]